MIGSGVGLEDGAGDPLAVVVALGADVPLDEAGPFDGEPVAPPEGCPEGVVVVALVEVVGFTGGDD